MTKEQYLESCAARYDQLQALNKVTDFYDYEVEFVRIWKDMGREVLENNINKLSKDKRKKNLTTLGYKTINNTHAFSQGKNGFQISPRMQELMVYAGQMDCYENCNEVIDKYLDVAVSSSQVHRVTDTYGQQVGETVNEHTTLIPLKKEETLYIEADGSLLLTRQQGWKEVKLGRIFKASDCIHAQGKAGWISNWQYVAHLGGHKKFIDQMEHLIDSYCHPQSKLIFITDGAPWLKNWIEDAYPCSHSIVDYYHACQYLHDFFQRTFQRQNNRRKLDNASKTIAVGKLYKRSYQKCKRIKLL